MHSHTAPSAARFQKIVKPKLTQRHSDALSSVALSSGYLCSFLHYFVILDSSRFIGR